MNAFFEILRDLIEEVSGTLSQNIKCKKRLEAYKQQALADPNRVRGIIEHHAKFGDAIFVRISNGHLAVAPKTNIIYKKN